ncbi:YnbE family lipoprotein [Novosphingobium sp. M1R2S20]|uniref:YnbE family lipoprotein n=1 Tax=Novosphingobium rhizovicinum TaxID=3228928 RepID=A0ABV3RDV4_9SPHN
MRCLNPVVPLRLAEDREIAAGQDRKGAPLQLPAAAVLLALVAGLGGCISVNAPDKPIVIELNINIKQEVIYRLAEDVKQNIEANPDIF